MSPRCDLDLDDSNFLLQDTLAHDAAPPYQVG